MEKLKDILGIILRVLSIIVLTIVTGASLTTAYVVFAPDNLPKPFYLTYSYPNTANGTPTTPGTKTVKTTPTTTPTPVIEIKPGQGVMIPTGTKIINLAEQNVQRYIRVTIVLEFKPDDPTYLKMTAEQKTAYTTTFTNTLNDKMPLIDDTIITLLSTKTFDNLYTSAGKETVRQELLNKLNTVISDQHVLSVYFTEFVVQ